jgi:glycosyltransferase involved in cell wall biosynthesis
MKELKALVVSYVFPPVGGAGVQRVTKLVKYLPRCGVRATVLTAAEPSVPLRDDSLERDVPSDTEVLRVRTLEPGYGAKQLAWQLAAQGEQGALSSIKSKLLAMGRGLLVPDPQLLWLPAAHWALGLRQASARANDVVFISAPPFSQFLLAAIARTRPGTALVLDYRDEWSTTASAYEMSGSARASALLERSILRLAHVITTATEEFRQALLDRFEFLEPGRVVTIPNGYDPEDFPDTLPLPPTDRCVLTYSGTVFRLTSAAGFMAGLRLLHERDPGLARLLEVRFVGRIVDTEQHYFDGSEALGVQRLGYVEHSRAISLLAQSHAALCILDEVNGVERIYPAKIFEIMRAGRPCLALTPEGALARLVRQHCLGEVVPPRNAEAIAAALARRLLAFRDNPSVAPHAPVDVERFDRKLQAAEFARVFRRAHALAQASPRIIPPPARSVSSA